MKPPTFAATLRKLMAAAKLTPPDLARVADMPSQTVHKLLNGERQPSLDTARRLCKALGKSLAEFD